MVVQLFKSKCLYCCCCW